MCPGSEGDKCLFSHEVDEFRGQMLGGGGVDRCSAPASCGGGKGGGMILHMAIEDRQGRVC